MIAFTRMPSATHLVEDDGGSMVGGPPRAVWHCTQSDPGTVRGNERWLSTHRTWPHLLWDPTTGEITQGIPFDRAARALEHPPGTVQTNRMGVLCIQIEVIGWADRPFTGGPMVGRTRIVAALDELGIPRRWPSGWARMGDRQWTSFSGHCGHIHVPHNTHTDPGRIDWNRLLPPPQPPEDEDDMALKSILSKQPDSAAYWLCDLTAGTRVWVRTPADLTAFRAAGAIDGNLSAAQLEDLKTVGPEPPKGA